MDDTLLQPSAVVEGGMRSGKEELPYYLAPPPILLETENLKDRGREPQLDRQKRGKQNPGSWKLETEWGEEAESPKETERRVGREERDGITVKEGEQEREGERVNTSDQGSRREDFILFYSMFPFLGSFPLRLSSLPVRTPTRSLWPPPAPPANFSFILAVSSSERGYKCPKPRDLPGSQKQRQQFVWDQRWQGGGRHPGTSFCPAKLHFLPSSCF